jgi:RNA polymerase sigma-32 factor
VEGLIVARTAALPTLTAEPGLTHYLEEIRRFPMLERQEEYMLAKRWREHGDRDAAHKLVTSHLRLVTKVARGYRGYGLPISEAISEGNVGLMQAVERFEPEKGFRFTTYAVWWIKAAIQEYIVRSGSLVKMGTTANQKKVFFNLRKAQSKISILDDGDMRLDQVKIIARRIGVTATDVIYMNRRLGGDASLNAVIRETASGRTGWWTNPRTRRRRWPRARSSITAARRCPMRSPCSTSASGASSRRAGSPRNRSRSWSWPRNSASRASAYARSRCAPSRRCKTQ